MVFQYIIYGWLYSHSLKRCLGLSVILVFPIHPVLSWPSCLAKISPRSESFPRTNAWGISRMKNCLVTDLLPCRFFVVECLPSKYCPSKVCILSCTRRGGILCRDIWNLSSLSLSFLLLLFGESSCRDVVGSHKRGRDDDMCGKQLSFLRSIPGLWMVTEGCRYDLETSSSPNLLSVSYDTLVICTLTRYC